MFTTPVPSPTGPGDIQAVSMASGTPPARPGGTGLTETLSTALGLSPTRPGAPGSTATYWGDSWGTESLLTTGLVPSEGLTTGLTPSETHFTELTAWKVAVLLPKVVLPVLIVFGVLGNVLTLVTLHSRAYGRSSVTVCFSLLALADTAYLLGTLRWWAKAMFDADFRLVSPAACRFHQWWTYYFRHLSSCTLAFITIERAVCVCIPFKWKIIFSTKKNAIVLGILVLILFGINLQIPINYGFNWDDNRNRSYCDLDVSKGAWYNKVWRPLDEVLYCFLPAAVILTGNVVIIWRMRRMPNITGDNEERNRSITVMLVAVSVVFLLTTLPDAIFQLGDADGLWPAYTQQENADVNLAWNVTVLWARVNNAINFILYCVTGSKFRHAFVETFCFWRRGTKELTNQRGPTGLGFP